MNINHAENIAAYYSSMGIKAVAVSSQTPKKERQKTIDAFKNGAIQVLVSVDLFSEGFDVPDAEFIQLARPTLSLAKHLQMVGRGLRVAKSKDYCIILDNVGNFWNFGLPSDDRDWQEFFNGYDKNKVRLFNKNRNAAPLYVLNRFVGTPIFEDEDEGKFERVADHQEQKEDIAILNAYHIVTNASGLQGLTDNKGNIILPCEYNSLKKDNDGIVTVKGKKNFYLDLFSGRKYSNRPKLCRINGFPVALYPGYKLYFRIRSRFVSNQTVIDLSNIPPFPLNDILRWDKYLFFHKEDGWKTYGIVKTSKHGGTACEGEDGGLYVQGSPFDKPRKVESMEAADQLLKKYEADYMHWLDKAKSINISHVNDVKNIFDKCRTKYYGHGIYEVTKLNGEKYWLDIQEKIKFLSRPHIAHYGIINLMYIDDVFYVRNYEHLWLQPLRLMDIHSNDKACIAHGKVWHDKSGGANEIVFISPDKSYVETKDRQYHYSYSMLDGELKISRFRATLERDKSSK